MDDATWALTEFATADLGDARRERRLLDLATALAQRPSAPLPQACEDHAQLDAAYRFFDNPHVTPAALLASHVGATRTRCAAHPLVLAAQDTTLLDFTHHPATTGLGPLATPKYQGLFAHSTVAFLPGGLPLGVLQQAIWARDPATVGKTARRRSLPIAEKESAKWLTSLAAVKEAAAACPGTRFVSVGDREADVYDLFILARPANVDLLVRASWDRCTNTPEKHLWASLAAAPVGLTVELAVPRRGEQAPRTATLTVR